jgi:hypothetical protein
LVPGIEFARAREMLMRTFCTPRPYLELNNVHLLSRTSGYPLRHIADAYQNQYRPWGLMSAVRRRRLNRRIARLRGKRRRDIDSTGHRWGMMCP